MPIRQALSLALLIVSTAIAQPETDARAKLDWVLVQLLAEPATGAAALHEQFNEPLAAAAPEQMLVAQLVQIQMGIVGKGPLVVERVDPNATDDAIVALVRSEDTGSTLQISLVLAPDGTIAGINTTPVAVGGKLGVETWADLDEVMAGLHGRASLAAMHLVDGELISVHAFQTEPQLAVGSAFKLYVLGALAQLIDETDSAWDDELAINPDHKSLPSGTMQNEPDGKTFKLAEYAAQMISISDNTATDHLIRHVGRDRVEAYLQAHQNNPSRTLPFMTTHEMFTIKLCGDPELAERYAAADIDERRNLLTTDVASAKPKMFLASSWAKPLHIDTIEWFATTPELCAVMADLADIGARPEHGALARALRLNPGMAFWRADWTDVAFKGGSEPGVLNLTWLLTRADGEVFALSLSWNDTEQAVDTTTLLDVAAEAASLLAEH